MNWGSGFCRPMPYHLAMTPSHVTEQLCDVPFEPHYRFPIKNEADDEARPLNASADAAARTRNTEILRRRISTASRLFLSSLSNARLKNGADDEARTRYLHLGKVALYQMSYIRKSESRINDFLLVPSVGIEPTTRGFSVLCSTN